MYNDVNCTSICKYMHINLVHFFLIFFKLVYIKMDYKQTNWIISEFLFMTLILQSFKKKLLHSIFVVNMYSSSRINIFNKNLKHVFLLFANTYPETSVLLDFSIKLSSLKHSWKEIRNNNFFSILFFYIFLVQFNFSSAVKINVCYI